MLRCAFVLAAFLICGSYGPASAQDEKTSSPKKLATGLYIVLRDSPKEKDVLPLKDGEALVINRHRYLKQDDPEPPLFVVVHRTPDVDLDLAGKPMAIMEGKDVVRILLKLQPKAATKLERVTTDSRGKQIAIVLEGEVITMHKIRNPIQGGEVQITSCVVGAANYLLERLEVHQAAVSYAEIRVVDSATGRGVPLVELTTVNQLRFVTDNAGRVAFNEPGLIGREVFFTVKSHGYEMKKDGFGYPGVRITPEAGHACEIKISRLNLAERLCRLTGEGRYRDTLLLGRRPPLADSPHPGLVAGQDSVQAMPYKGEIYWFWGDTSRMSYPLGLFRTAGAKTAVPGAKADFADGIAFDYFVDKNGFARAMIPLSERPKGVIWIDGVCTVPDDKGVEKLIAHYSRRKGLAEELEHGIAVFDDEKAVFVPVKELPLAETWRFPHGHPVAFEEGGRKWLLCGHPALNVRVPATLKDVLDTERYEAFTCAAVLAKNRPVALEKNGDSDPIWHWQPGFPPMGSEEEAELVKAGKMKLEQSRFYPANVADPKERVRLHSGSVRWNEYRKRWVMLAGQVGGKSSLLGEVWYAEAENPTGPFKTAVKVVTHENYSFYNVCHHDFLDREGGRYLHFEGTYTSEFSGNPDKTPRYDYNQILYRLDLDHVKKRK